MDRDEFRQAFFWFFVIFVFLGVTIGGGMYGCPRYAVWEQEMTGKAEFAKAEQNRRIRILEAEANLESQKLNAEAEIVRAEGMAKAIAIENGNLSDRYIQYLWVRQLSEIQNNQNANTIIYIPTEGNIPLLEASRLSRPPVINVNPDRSK